MASKRKPPLTKEQKFNLNIIYKPLFLSRCKYDHDYVEKANDKELLSLISRYINTAFPNDYELYKFLDEYKEQLKWSEILKHINYVSEYSYDTHVRRSVTLRILLTNYSEYFNAHCWGTVTRMLVNGDEDLIREYKDKLSWGYLSRNFPFSLDFMKEMSEYVNFNSFILRNNYSLKSHVTRTKIMDYIKEHINEIQ